MRLFTICPEIENCTIPVSEMDSKLYGHCECDQSIPIFEVDPKDCFEC